MEEEIFIEAAKEEETGIDLQYIILCTVDPRPSDKDLSKVFSLLVIKTSGTYESESLFIYDITRSRERALEIVKVMRENTVTPCSVPDVLDDIL